MGIADFAKQAEELADKAKEAAKNVDADQVAETAHDLRAPPVASSTLPSRPLRA